MFALVNMGWELAKSEPFNVCSTTWGRSPKMQCGTTERSEFFLRCFRNL